MASLRRPSQAIPSPAKVPASSRPPLPQDAVQKRDARRKSRVGDKIKKRMSMRYAGTDDFLASGSAPPVPGLPVAGADWLKDDPYQNVLSVDVPPTTRTAPADEDDDDDDGGTRFGQFASEDFEKDGLGRKSGLGARQGQRGGDEAIHRRGAGDMSGEDEWDLTELGNDGFDVQGFIRRTLAGADQDELKRFQAALQRAKQANAKELQQNVFKNYAEFVNMSKEIAALENDMLELKELLSQWKDLPQLMGMDNSLAPTLDKNGNLERRRTQRNSIADLGQMYRAQLSNLWSTVEGSQKYITLAPGRHVVFETHNFVELNAATYKAKQNVSLFLLNDLLLMAGRRRTKSVAHGSSERDKERDRGRMVAERCWVLAELVVVDVKDSGDLTNALKIRRGKEVCVYRTSKPEDKKALLAAFRQVSQELGEKKRKESEKEQQRRKSMWQGGDASLPPSPGIGLLSPGRPRSSIGMTMADSKDLQWIDDFGDELTMTISMHDWDAAVDLVEKSRELEKLATPHPQALEILTSRLSHLRPTLTSHLLHDLSSQALRKGTTANLVALLTRLGASDEARETFLKARREIMMDRVREIKCEGDTTIYISELAIVCFTVIRHTSDWYMTAFKENRMASGFIVWAKAQIETFAELFRRQVYVSTIQDGVAEDCLRVVASHNRKLLRDVGLDFTFLLSTHLQPDPNSRAELHPIFDLSVPSTGYQVDSSIYESFAPESSQDQAVEDAEPPQLFSGSTRPLSINPKSPRKARPSDAATTPIATLQSSNTADGSAVRSETIYGTPESPSTIAMAANELPESPTMQIRKADSNTLAPSLPPISLGTPVNIQESTLR